MAGGETIGEKLARLRARSGLSLTDVADAGGYKGRSSVQRFFAPEYNPEYIPMDLAQRLIKAFEGKGQPPITVQELLTLAGVPSTGAGSFFQPGESLANIGSMPRDVPVYGTALAAEGTFDVVDGSGHLGVEQAALDQSEVLGYLRRPPALVGRTSVYGVYISGASMVPRFRDGEAVFVDPKRPAMIDDDVVVSLAAADEHDGDRVATVLIKCLVRRTSAFVELKQYNPPITFRIDARRVKSIHRIVPTAELLS